MKESIKTPLTATTALAIMAVFAASSAYSYQPGMFSAPYDWLRLCVLAGTALALLVALRGFVVLRPGEALILFFAGKYTGTIMEDGSWWINPFYSRRRVDCLTQAHYTGLVDASDFVGDPVEIAATVEWRIALPAVVTLTMDDPCALVASKVRAAIQDIAREYPYDNEDLELTSLRFDLEKITHVLKQGLVEVLAPYGIEILSVHIGHANHAKSFLAGMSNANYLYHILKHKSVSLADEGFDAPNMRIVSRSAL